MSGDISVWNWNSAQLWNCENLSYSSFIIYDVTLSYIIWLKIETIFLEEKHHKSHNTKNKAENEKQINSTL